MKKQLLNKGKNLFKNFISILAEFGKGASYAINN